MMGMQKPIRRSAVRLKLGKMYYGIARRFLWIKMNKIFATLQTGEKLPFSYFTHQTILLRKLKDVNMWMQYNKITNLKIAAERMNGIILQPGETFSYWRLIGKPTKHKGYKKGLILFSGTFLPGVGGGLCQLSNLLYWMTLHTPLTVMERHRHGYDVFPDSNRTQPFGSGATCFYPYGDLMLCNPTQETYQLVIRVGEKNLEGEWRVSEPPRERFEIVERNHEFRGEYWGGYTRHNRLYQRRLTMDGELLEEKLAVENSAIAMYAPFLAGRNRF